MNGIHCMSSARWSSVVMTTKFGRDRFADDTLLDPVGDDWTVGVPGAADGAPD